MKKGDIIWATEIEKHVHPIVFLEKIDDLSFKACILSSKAVNGNLPMKPSHFCTHDRQGVIYNFQYENSHLVTSNLFIKKENWIAHGRIAGKLTPKGVSFVEKKISDQEVYLEGPIWELKPESMRK
ncbi:MAG: hypothetical protein JEY96_14955 [Bacteroidales bacterium]|nr:hypothetical protein [Bacteroidales bacterium]